MSDTPLGDERIGTPEQIEAQRARIKQAQAEGLDITAVRREIIKLAQLRRRKFPLPKAKIDLRLRKMLEAEQRLRDAQGDISELTRGVNVIPLVTKLVDLANGDLLDALQADMRGKDRKRRDKAVDRLFDLTMEVFRAQKGGKEKKSGGRTVEVAEWPTEGAKS